MPPTRDSDLKDLSQLLPYLRQLLTCCACAGLLDNAMISLTCGHCYCYECQYREPLLKIQCRQCRERTGLVMESQLQIVVECYKRMCQIIGEELRKNPCALDIIVDKEETDEVDTTTKLNISIKLPNEDQDKCREAGIVPEKEATTASKKTAVTVGDPKKKTTVTVEDPIGEIVREVEKGTKVSRAILWIKPPTKYLNNKGPVSSRVVTKKEAAAPPPPSNPSNPDTTPPDKAPSVVCEGGQCTDAHAQEIESSSGPATRKRKGKFTQVRRTKKAKKNVACNKVEHVAMVIATAKRKLRKPTSISVQRKQSNVARKNRLMSRTENKESTEQPVPKASNSEKMVAGKDCKSKPAVLPVSEVSTVLSLFNQGPMNFMYGGEMKVSGLSISVHCFNDSYFKISSRNLFLLSHAQPVNELAAALLQPSSTSGVAKKTSFAGGEWQKSTRQRRWDPLCPSVVAKRSMEVVAKTLVLQSKAAKAKKKMRYNKVKPQKQAPEQLAKKLSIAAKPRSPEPVPPPPPTAAFRPVSRPVSAPSPFTLSRPPTGDIPLPEHIPILPSEGVLDDDINWKQLSDFLESNDEESMSSLPPPISRYGPPPLTQHCRRHHHPRPLDPVHFDNQFRPPRHLMHPPFMPHPHPHPGHLHIPPPHLPPLPGPHTPMIPSPFTPDMQPPDGFFSPMMGPDNFLPPGGGLGGPDGCGGYSSPMTPQRGYPPGVMCPMEYQHSPRHHHHHPHPGGHFPMPSPRMSFPPPPERSFPGPPPPPPKKAKGSNGSTMSKMVTKMKIKSSAGQKQKKLLSPGTPTGEQQQQGKKRRSPGYSEAGWRCRCGTNNVMFPDKVCAKGKCPCYTKGVACKNCLCRHCHNPFGAREVAANLPADAAATTAATSEQTSE